MYKVNRNPSARELRHFGLVVFGGFAVLGALLGWSGRTAEGSLAWVGSARQVGAVVLWLTGVLVAVVAMASQAAGRPVYVTWMTAGSYTGSAVTFVVLTAVYFLVLPVFALIRFKDPLRLKPARSGKSYWQDHARHESTLERTARPF